MLFVDFVRVIQKERKLKSTICFNFALMDAGEWGLFRGRKFNWSRCGFNFLT